MQSKETSKNKHVHPQVQYVAIDANTMLSNKNQNIHEIDLAELWRAIWSGKFTVILVTILFALASVIYAIKQPNIYRATVVLAPASQENGVGGLGALAGQFGGLASMAGINLGSGSTNKVGLALEVLKSRAFIEGFIDRHDLLIPLMAAEGWNQTIDELVLDGDIYNKKTKQWVRDVKLPKSSKPSSWEAFEEFKGIFRISTDKESGMVTLSIEHYSPVVAIEWLDLLVNDINSHIREQDKEEALNSITFLTDKLEHTHLSEMHTVFYQLIEEQTKTMMLTEVSKEYVLKTIDPANAPDDKVNPNRVLICLVGTLLGALVSLVIVLVRYFKVIKKQEL